MRAVGSDPALPVEIGVGVWQIRNRGHSSNTYVCRLDDGESCLVVDPGLDDESVVSALETLGLTPIAIFCTHGHFDHLGSAAAISDAYGAPVHLHEADMTLVRSAKFHMLLARVEGPFTAPTIDVVASSGSRYLEGDDQVQFIHTPGHTAGSCCLSYRQYVFTGDTLYRDSVGLVDFPGEDPTVLRSSIRNLWASLPASSVICPGHGGCGLLSSIQANNHELIDFLGRSSQQTGV